MENRENWMQHGKLTHITQLTADANDGDWRLWWYLWKIYLNQCLVVVTRAKKRKWWSHIRYTSNGHNQRSSPAAASADICLLPMFVKIFAIQDCPQTDESTDWWWWLMFIQNIMASLKSKIVSVSVECGNPCNPFPRIPCNFSFGHGLAQMRTRTRSKLPKGALSLHWNLIYSYASTGTEICYLKNVHILVSTLPFIKVAE